MENPKVSVIMPVYNGEKYLKEAIDSILTQTFSDFEFIIINDGSTDETAQIVKSYKDPRIVFIEQENKGLAKTLNVGLKFSKGEYLARMDADDISLPNRFEEQLIYMQKYPDLGVCGSWVKTFGDTNESIWKYPCKPGLVRCNLLFSCVIAHPSVMINRHFFEENQLKYDEKFSGAVAEDYELWIRCARLFSVGNLNKILLYYRIHSRKTSGKKAEVFLRRSQTDSLREQELVKLGMVPTKSELNFHNNFSKFKFKQSHDFVEQSEAWLLKLLDTNNRTQYYPRDAFRETLAFRWYLLFSEVTHVDSWMLRKFYKSPITEKSLLRYKQTLRLVLRAYT